MQNKSSHTILPLINASSAPSTLHKMKFSIKDFFSKCDQICNSLPEDLVILTEEILSGKLRFQSGSKPSKVKNMGNDIIHEISFEFT